MATQVAWVMIRDLHHVPIKLHLNLPGADQLVDQLCMMDQRVVPAESWIFVLNCVQTMWAGCHDPFRFDLIQYFYVLRSQPKENIFATCPAGGVSVTGFVFSQNR